ncbi:hypothetical protein RND71_010083 [Anisodus tanguticus]|uniref:Uncharacterized protein n=1 Tax=Anisodus tanguticus TaxID=243964 RepID=A0AAE1SJN8_9SOLA|nr:hypothetical protein RND71_010083 [Anisodus tanguticus]
MGKQPVKLKAVVYALSPFQQKVMPGLWKDLAGKTHHKRREMKVIAAYLLAVLGGNTCPTDKDLKKILGSEGVMEFHEVEHAPCLPGLIVAIISTTNTTPLPSEDIEEEEEKEVEKEEYNEEVNLPWKLLGGWQINTRIMSLEKEIAEFNRQIADQKIAQKNAGFHKRKIDETEWLSNKEQQRVVVNHVGVSNNSLLEGGGTAGHNYGYSMSPQVLHGPVAGSINGNVVGSLAGPVGGSHAGQLYGSCGNAYRPTPYMESSKGLSNTIPGNAYRPAPWVESSKGLPNTIPGEAYRPPPYLEGSTGLPNTTPPPHQFANTVPAAELSQSSGSQAVDAPAEIVLRSAGFRQLAKFHHAVLSHEQAQQALQEVHALLIGSYGSAASRITPYCPKGACCKSVGE